ncbi:hypothetical protein TRFO_02790 [Tritrichomonas foetus]|uniref:Transmembrane protein n=1 Tax=Tritrichomonas foetus TaxID=1144522 RepID=A0A1J4L0J4_9EUKA|nr:hypothetical protein TRFO_02790 [Tritrichomonas foetus]|eukprot:OHT15486.1 hypothetical protein TRFO_02790 [Tritrichomonas foetus]
MFEELTKQDYFPWIAMWFVLIIFESFIWKYIVNSIRQKIEYQDIIIGIFVFAATTGIELLIFVQVLGMLPYGEYGFYPTVFAPTVAFYFLLVILLFGIIKSALCGFLTMKSLRCFKNYLPIIPLFKFCFSLAYSVPPAALFSMFHFIISLSLVLSFPKAKKRAPKKKVSKKKKEN